VGVLHCAEVRKGQGKLMTVLLGKVHGGSHAGMRVDDRQMH
jgi:hypothetical protein